MIVGVFVQQVALKLAMAKKVQKKSVKKAAIYARVSSTANKDGAGISRQTAVCKAKCENTKHPLYAK